MEYLDGPNLRGCLPSIADENIPTLVEQLVSCCEYLESLQLVHRDIKPANIVVLAEVDRGGDVSSDTTKSF
jgi:serine/threonine-protein kinase